MSIEAKSRNPEFEHTRRPNLILVRHGQSVGNVEGSIVEDPVLTPLGRQQADNAGRALRETLSAAPTAIVHTGLSRSFMTAQLLAEAAEFTSVPFVMMTEFRERDMGSYNGRSFEEFLEENPEMIPYYEQYGQSCIWFYPGDQEKGVESLASMEHRVTEGLSTLVTRFGDQPVLVIAHAGSIKVARYQYEQPTLDLARYMCSYVPGNGEIYIQGAVELSGKT